MTNWKQQSITYTIHACRDGWLGVFDAVKSAITRKPRLTAPKSYTLSIYVKPVGSAVCDITLVESKND